MGKSSADGGISMQIFFGVLLVTMFVMLWVITASAHAGMKDYVRPLSKLIDSIAHEQGRPLT